MRLSFKDKNFKFYREILIFHEDFQQTSYEFELKCLFFAMSLGYRKFKLHRILRVARFFLIVK